MRYHDYDIADHHKDYVGLAYLHLASRAPRRQRRILANRLLDTGLFSHLTEHALMHLASEAHEFSYPSHWTVLAAGNVPDLALLLLGGSATYSADGQPVGSAGPGTIVGLMEAIEGRPTRMSLISDVPLCGVAIDPQILSRALQPAIDVAARSTGSTLQPAPAH